MTQTNTLKLKTRETKADFLALPANERRIALAKDVIASVLADKIIARKGIYIQIRDGKYNDAPSEVEVCHAIFDSDAHA